MSAQKKTIFNTARYISLTLLFVVLVGSCATAVVPVTEERNYITGSITARNLVIFPDQSQVEIVLLDDLLFSAAEESEEEESDAGLREVISKQIIKNPKVNPVRFTLRFDPDDIRTFRSYSVLVNVYAESGEVLYRSDSSYPVITKNNPYQVDVLLQPL
jgi:uncharacterized lipoprotein YbaY